ncbi:MAG: RNA-guided endonuclease InsQ/TnpB family protein, partial [Xenococcaceae cyanobacterium]
MTERAYKYRFYPTPEQENLLRRTMGCVRLVYNKALAERTEGWYQRQERIGYSQTSSMLTTWKKKEELFFLNEVSCVPLQQTLRHLTKAFESFWAKRSKYPNFKKKSNGGNAEFTRSAFKWKDGKLWLAKCFEPLNIVWSRYFPVECDPSTVTVKLEPNGRWFVSFLVVDPTIKTLPPTAKNIGLDAGLTSLVTTSDGEKVTNPKHFNNKYRKLRAAQKTLSRRQFGSKNREKARIAVARIQARIKDSRKDFLHKLTTQLVRENQVIAVEDLALRNMVKNRSLARSISDAGWGELVRQLEYKSQ